VFDPPTTVHYPPVCGLRRAGMPAITLGLAEVEDRLRVLRRRLNSVTAQHSVYVSLSAIMLVLAALIVLGLRASAMTFRIAAWGGALLSVGAVAAAMISLRRRWLDVHATAHLADRQGKLTDRLATLVDLRARPRTSRLGSVLVGQALALGAQWQPQRIAPRRVPRSVFLLVASLLALASTALVNRQVPPAGSVAAAGAAKADTVRATASNQGAGAAGLQVAEHLTSPPRGEPPRGEPPNGEPLRSGLSESGAPSNPPSDQPRPDGSLASLPDRLQEAIRRAFHAEATDQPRQLAARSGADAGDSAEHRKAGGGDGDKQPHSSSDTAKPESQVQAAQKGTGAGQQNKPGQSQGGQNAQPPDPNTPNQNLDGPAPAAGDGSNPGGLMDAKGTGPALSPDAPKTFKLTITSFLRAAEQQGTQPRQSAKGAGTGGSAGTGAGSAGALSDRQLNDDAVRKADIPPEYEDIVRRVYSLRAEQ
jgi:hypothetical protein